MQYPRSRLLIFSKAPIVGTVKTRLIPVLGAVGAANLQRRLTQRLVAAVSAAALCPLELWVTPDVRHPFFQQLASRYAVRLQQQNGENLGERMAHASQTALTCAESVLLIGTDCPLLDPDWIAQALQSLSRYDAVLGPAEDGGYVLIGLKRPHAALFQAMPWGSDVVAELTRQRLRAAGWRWLELPCLWDVDRPEDLPRLYRWLPELKL